MKHAWIVVANSILANIYVVSERNFHFKLIKRMQHPQSRLKEQELDSDRPGHYQKGLSNIRGAYVESTSHKSLEVEHFVKEICAELEKGRIAQFYGQIIIVAESRFYGLINANTTQAVRKLIKFHLSKDYTHYSEKDLIIKLKEKLAHDLRCTLICDIS